MSRSGLYLCLLGGSIYIFVWLYPCVQEISYPIGYQGFFTGWCIFNVHYLIVGTFGIIGAIIGWKSRREGYILSIGAGVFYYIYIIILSILRSYFFMNIISSIGAFFILVGGIYGYYNSRQNYREKNL